MCQSMHRYRPILPDVYYRQAIGTRNQTKTIKKTCTMHNDTITFFQWDVKPY